MVSLKTGASLHRCMSMSMMHAHFLVHASCPCPSCMSVSMLHVNVNAACPCPFGISVSKLHTHVYGPWLCPCCMFMFMLHVCVLVRASYTYIYIYRNAGMPDCPAFGQSGTGINRTNDAGTGLYWTKLTQSGILSGTRQKFWMPECRCRR
jgi:hypothetical protein